jgi:hypothetical protein
MKTSQKIIALVSTVPFLTPLTAYAADPLTLRKVVKLITDAINMLIGLAITIAVAMIIYYGFSMALSRGDATKFKKASTGLWYAVIGLAVILGIGLIVATIGSFAENPASVVK